MNKTNFQNYLDQKNERNSAAWKDKLVDLNWGGEFSVADAEGFFRATTAKNVSSWAVETELKARHSSLKKIIDSV